MVNEETGMSSLRDLLGEDRSAPEERAVRAIERVSSSLRDVLLAGSESVSEDENRLKERSTLRDVLLSGAEKEPEESKEESKEESPEKNETTLESALESLQDTLEKIMGAQTSELAKMTKTIVDIGKHLENDKPVSKIKVRNIERSRSGRMKDVDLIVERDDE